jgi:hypothetical protein
MKYAFKVQIAQKRDLHRIKSFLASPEINNAFCKPLSERNISIGKRVWLKHRQGLWVIAEIDDRLVSCVAILPEGKGVSFSTFACINDIKSKLAGGGVWKQSLNIVRERFDVSFIEIDSWEGNHFINRFLRKRGFKKIRTYPDPGKRPDSVNSVLYRMTFRENE